MSRFEAWSTDDLAAQCRMQAREQLDPELSEFMLAVAVRLSGMKHGSPAGNITPVLSDRLRAAAKWIEDRSQGPTHLNTGPLYRAAEVIEEQDRVIAKLTAELRACRQPETPQR